MNIHALPLLATLKPTYELPTWNVDDSKTYRVTVTKILEMDALESITGSNLRHRSNGNSSGGQFNTVLGANNTVSGSGSYNLLSGDTLAITGSRNLNIGKSNAILSDDSASIGESNSHLSGSSYGFSVGLSNKISGDGNFVRGTNALGFRTGELVSANGMMVAIGDAQQCMMHAWVVSDGTATPAELTLNGDDITMVTDTVMAFEIQAAAVVHSGTPGVAGDSMYKVFRGLIKNVGGTVSLVGAIITTAIATDTEADWTWTITADNTNKKLKILITPQNGQVVRAFCTITGQVIGYDTYS